MTQLGFVAILLGLMLLSAAGGADRFADLSAVPPGARHGGVRADAGRLRVQGRPAAVARLVAARAPRGAQPGLGVDERGHGQPRDLRDHPHRPAAARAGAPLVGGDAAGDRRGVGGVRGVAGIGGHRSQTAAGLLDRGEHGADHRRAGRRDPAGRLRRRRRRPPWRWPRRCCTWWPTPGSRCLGFLAAGSVLAATGLRDLDRLGGLARRMPATTILFGVAALGASGLPLGAGFVSEWLLAAVADPRRTRAQHRGRAGHPAGGRRGCADHRTRGRGDGQGVRRRVSGPAPL